MYVANRVSEIREPADPAQYVYVSWDNCWGKHRRYHVLQWTAFLRQSNVPECIKRNKKENAIDEKDLEVRKNPMAIMAISSNTKNLIGKFS